jgi:hypothetical protein
MNILDDDQLLTIVWQDATGTRLTERTQVHALVEFSWAVASAALGVHHAGTMLFRTRDLIQMSESLSDLSLDVIDTTWNEHAFVPGAIRPKVHRYVFHLGLMSRPDRTGVSELEAPSPRKLEWLWHRGVGSTPPGDGAALGRFINAVLIRARHEFLALDKRLEDWELLESLDGSLFSTDAIWDQTAGLNPAPRAEQTMFRRVVSWYLAPRLDGGALTLSPRSIES